MSLQTLNKWSVWLLLGMIGAVQAAAPIPVGSLRLVHDREEYAVASKSLRPGDTVVLADGEWRDFELLFKGEGKPDRPITLTAQTPGKVALTGRSNLRLSGEYLVVSNLVFRDGATPTGEVVSFRESRRARANHSRVTGVVIDRYNQAERMLSDHWVALYGHDNRFDHGHLVGKSNLGTTLVVVRDAEQGLDNRHRIDHNWFGWRPNLGANGGETIRVGTSHDAASDSHTTVEDNRYEHCDGEVEIISNKSGANVYRGNVFKESRGALTLRHGDGNLVEGNVFLGGGQPHTGGVRVINRRQTVRNNYFEGLAGEGFASALSILYGVPDSPPNRYLQVDHAVIEHNTFVDARSLLFGAGKDAERTAAPVASRFADNLIVNTDDRDPLQALADVGGIAFAGNVQSPRASALAAKGISARQIALTRAASGLLVAPAAENAGARRDLRPLAREETGVAWCAKDAPQSRLDRGSRHEVAPGEGNLERAVAAAAAGDRLALAPGRYVVERVLGIDRALTIEGPADGEATIAFSRSTLFELRRGGELRLSRLHVSGELAPDEAGNAVVRARAGSGAANTTLIVEDSRFSALDVNRAFDVVALGKGTLADLVALRHVAVENASGAVIAAHAETDDLGTFNIERLEIVDSQFRGIAGAAVDLYRGGGDESTFGPKLRIERSLFEHVGGRRGASLVMHGVQRAELADNRFVGSAPVRFERTPGSAAFLAARNTFEATPAIQSDIPIETLQ